MHRLWGRYIGPLIRQLAPKRILEVGGGAALTTAYLVEHVRAAGGVLDVVEVNPGGELRAVIDDAGAELATLHAGRGIAQIPELIAPDVALLDGDPNWRTVYTELSLLRMRARAAGTPMPVALVHNCAWPHARRDMYYNPNDFLDHELHPYAYKGLLPGRAELAEEGLGASQAHALIEGGAENGVLTAVEDFVAASGNVRLWTLPFLGGLGILVPLERVTPELEALIDGFYATDALLDACMAIEEDGVRTLAALMEERRRLEIRTDALARARRLLADRAERIAELEAKLAAS